MDLFDVWKQKIATTASAQSYMAGYLDGLNNGQPSFLVNQYLGQDRSDYYAGFQDGVRNYYRPEPFVVHANADDPEEDAVSSYDDSYERIAPHQWRDRKPNPHATDWEKLNRGHRAKIKRQVFNESPNPKRPLTHERMIRNVIELYRQFQENDPASLKEGMDWYHSAHQETKELGRQYHIPFQHAVGMIAALSPQTEWDENKALGRYMMHHLSQPDAVLRLSPEHAQQYFKDSQTQTHPGGFKVTPGKRFADMDPLEAAHALKAQAKYTDDLRSERLTQKGQPSRLTWTSGIGNMAKAVEIHRGGSPSDVLNGHKVRSFANNIGDPDSAHPDVTVDTHMVGAVSHAKISAKSQKMARIFNTGKNSHANVLGTYALYADAIRKAHKRLVQSGEMPADSHPHQLQAGIWLGWRNMTERVKSKHPYPIFRGASVSKQASEEEFLFVDPEDEDEEEQWERLDPMEGDLPDPDICPEEHEAEVIKRYQQRYQNNQKEAGIAFPPFHHLAKGDDEFAFEPLSNAHTASLHPGEPALPWTDAESDDYSPDGDLDMTDPMWIQANLSPFCAIGLDDSPPANNVPPAPSANPTGRTDRYREDAEGDPNPSPWWQAQHSGDGPNPASTGPETFGNTLDPDYYNYMMGQPEVDKELLAPGPATTSMQLGPNWGFDYTASHEAKTESPDPRAWLMNGGGGYSDKDIAKAARAHLAALTAQEQEELIKEGEAEGVIARNYDSMDLSGTHYLQLEAELKAREEDATDLFL